MSFPRSFALVVALLAAAVTCGKIDHFIVIMFENRSFDHMLGRLNKNDSRIDGLTGAEYNVARGKKWFVNSTAPYVSPFDPHHSFPDTTKQIFGNSSTWVDPAPMSGFAENHLKYKDFWQVMNGFTPERVPAISTLATEFGLFDHYFSALPGPTVPNRLFFHSGTTDGTTHGDDIDLIEGWPQKCFVDVLNENNVTWRNYFQDVPDMLYLRSPRKPQNMRNMRPWDEFLSDAAEGTLPTYSWLSPQFYPTGDSQAKDQHPDHDVVEGERLLASVYEALRKSPKWGKTALLVTYDEHGGFYDHVSPPMHNIPNPDGKNASDDASHFNFTREGIRIPAILISPLVPKNTVVKAAPSAVYEHTSIWNTFTRLFGMMGEPITKRYQWAAPYDHVLSLSEPRTDCPMTIPVPKVDSVERRAEVLAAQLEQAPNGLQKELYAMVENLFGRDGADGVRFETQRDMGEYVREQVGKFRAQQATLE
jgi:phospholipase C